MLGPRYPVGGQCPVYLGGEFDLDPGLAGLDAVGGAVVEGDPVGEDVVGVEALDEEKGLWHRGKSFLSLDLPHLRLQSRPGGDILGQLYACKEVLFVGKVGGIYGDGGHTGIEQGGYFHTRLLDVGISLYAVMVRVDGNGHGDVKFVGKGVDQACQVPEVHRAVGPGPAFRLGDLHDDGRVGPLGGFQGAADDELVAAVGGDGHGLALGDHGPVDHLAADDERLGVGEKLNDVGRTPSFKGSVEVLQGNS